MINENPFHFKLTLAVCCWPNSGHAGRRGHDRAGNEFKYFFLNQLKLNLIFAPMLKHQFVLLATFEFEIFHLHIAVAESFDAEFKFVDLGKQLKNEKNSI